MYKFGAAGTDEGAFDTPSGLAVDSQDKLYVSDTYNHRIQKFTAAGKILLSFGSEGDGPGQLKLPWGVSVDATGNVFASCPIMTQRLFGYWSLKASQYWKIRSVLECLTALGGVLKSRR